jgi:nucleotide-binding universal stress UspA family protein
MHAMKNNTSKQTTTPPDAGRSITPCPSEFRLQQILVPVDFTECTEKALAYAVPFARQFGAELTLLHVIEPAYLPATEMGLIVPVEGPDEAGEQLAKLQRRLADQVRCRTLVKSGTAESEIIGVARELNVDLIVLSTHGRSGMERLLMGSTVEKVMRRACCPIFVVRPHEHDFVAEQGNGWSETDELASEVEAEMKAGL